jgi:hypothetical protein
VSAEHELTKVNLFEFVAGRILKKLDEEPITVTVHLSGGSIEMPIGPKHPWFKELHQRRTEQISALRAKLPKTQTKKKSPAFSLIARHRTQFLRMKTLTLETESKRAEARPQVPPRQREFISLDVLMMLRAVIGQTSSRSLIVFRERSR